jgi:RNA polymerase sigma-70 factor (sigma-E family)
MTFEEFAAAHLDRLLRFATVLCGEPGLAEDVLQEVLLRAHKRWHSIGGLDRPDRYVRKMIINEHLSWRRKWSRLVPTADVRPPGAVPDPAEGHAERRALLAELARLPERQRAVLVLRYYSGLPDREIADLLGCQPSAVRAYAARALATLRVDSTSLLLTKDG